MANTERSRNAARAALDAYRRALDEAPDESHLRDLMADLAHLADHRLDPYKGAAALDSARENYEHERWERASSGCCSA